MKPRPEQLSLTSPENELTLNLFEIFVRVRSDRADFLRFLADMYQHFIVEHIPPTAPNLIECSYFAIPCDPHHKHKLDLNGETWELDPEIEAEGYAYDSILSTVLSRVRSHLIIHAGVVARGGQATLVVADSGYGKTTLVLELVSRGFQFLSDELAPVARNTHQVEPFPRSLRLREPTLDLVAGIRRQQNAILWFDKFVIDIEQIYPGSLGTEAQIRSVIIVQDSLPDDKTTPYKEIGIFLNRHDTGLLSAAEELTGVQQAQLTHELGYPVLRYQAEHPMQILPQIEELCRERNILVIDVNKRPLRKPSFHGPTQLSVLPKSQTAFELIRQFQPGHKSEILTEEYQGKATKLYLELISILSEARCYRLTPGPLSEMADIICSL